MEVEADSEDSSTGGSATESQGPAESGSKDSTAASRAVDRGKIKAEELKRKEEKIQNHLRETVEVSRAIRWIVEERLFRARGFAVLEDYGRSKFGIGARRMCQLASHARVYDILEENQPEIRKRIGPDGAFAQPTDIPLPAAGAWARPLHRLANQERTELIVEVWAAVVRRYGSSITGRRVEGVRNEVLEQRTS